MGYFIDEGGGYHEGDQIPGDVAVPQRPDANHVWSNGQWVAGPTPVPASVPNLFGRLALLQAGRLADVEAALAALAEPQKAEAMVWWDYSPVIERQHPLTIQIGAACGMTDADIDGFFVSAASIQAASV